MNERTKNDMELIQRFLECDVKYQKGEDDITFFVEGKLGETKFPAYRVVFKDTTGDDDALEALSDMAIGRFTQELLKTVQTFEASELRDMINMGLSTLRDKDLSETQQIVSDFQNTDFRSQLNLLDTHFNNIEVEPVIEESKLNIYYTHNGVRTFITDVNKDSNVVRVMHAFDDKVNKEPSTTFITALRNQIREFKDLFRDELIEKKKKEAEKYVKK